MSKLLLIPRGIVTEWVFFERKGLGAGLGEKKKNSFCPSMRHDASEQRPSVAKEKKKRSTRTLRRRLSFNFFFLARTSRFLLLQIGGGLGTMTVGKYSRGCAYVNTHVPLSSFGFFIPFRTSAVSWRITGKWVGAGRLWASCATVAPLPRKLVESQEAVCWLC